MIRAITKTLSNGREVTYYLDELGREYNSIEHLIRCAIAEALGLC